MADGRPGSDNQALGVAEKLASLLGASVVPKRIFYNSLIRLPNFILRSSLAGVDKASSSVLSGSMPDFVVAASRRLAPVALNIKKRSKGKTFAVQLMWPGAPSGGFDLIAIPEHDNVGEAPNIFKTKGAAGRINAGALAREAGLWRDRISHLPLPRIAVLAGGIETDSAASLGKAMREAAARNNASLLVTTSRRTRPESARALFAEIPPPSFLFEWKEGAENPYIGFLALADAIVVTGDSMSMCSEAAETGKPVYIFAPEKLTGRKYRFLHRRFYELGLAKPLADLNLSTPWNHSPPDIAGEIAGEVIKRLARHS